MVKFQKKKKKHPRKYSIDKLLYGLARSIGLPLWIRSVWTKGILMPFSLCRGRMNQNELDLCQRASCSGIRWPHISCEGQWKLSNKRRGQDKSGPGSHHLVLTPSKPQPAGASLNPQTVRLSATSRSMKGEAVTSPPVLSTAIFSREA